MKVLIIILNILHLVKGIIPVPEIYVSTMIQCALNIQSLSPEPNILIAYTSDTIDETNSLITQLLGTDTVVEVMHIDEQDSTKFVQIPQKFFTHILIMKSIEEYEEFLKKVYATAIWNARGKYIFIFMGRGDLLKIFEISWSKYLINIDVILLTNDVVQVYTYFPYGNGKCGEDIQVEGLGECGSLTDPFPEKVPADMNGCTIRALVNIYPPFGINSNIYNDSAELAGHDVVILNNLVQKTNMTRTAIAVEGAFAHKDAAGKYEGALHYISEDICDIALGSLFPNVSYFIDFDVTLFYYYINFSWVVPAALPGKQWESLILIFSQSLWLVIFGTLVGNVLIWFVFARGTKDRQQFKELSICMMKSWYSLLQGGISLPLSFTMRFLVIFWTLFALLLATLYQSQLVSILLTPVYEHQVANTRELVDSNIQIVFKNDFIVRMSNSDKPVDKEIVKKGQKLTTAEHADFGKIFRSKQAFLGNVRATIYMIPRNFSFPSGRPAVYMFKDQEFGNPNTMFVKKGYPLLDRFNDLLLRFLAYGLVAKWVSDATYYIPKVEDDSAPQKIQVSHLAGAFFVLMIGMIGALLILLTEMITHWCQQINNRRKMKKKQRKIVYE